MVAIQFQVQFPGAKRDERLELCMPTIPEAGNFFFEMPNRLSSELGPWFDKLIASNRLPSFLAECRRLYGDFQGSVDRTGLPPREEAISWLGTHADAVMNRGFSALPWYKLAQLVDQPHRLEPLQALILMDANTWYWNTLFERLRSKG